MPEQGFRRPERGPGVSGSVSAAWQTLSDGRRVVAGHPVMVLVLGVAFVLGAWSEGWDRLWEAHLLLDVGLPDLLGLDDVVWFGVLAAGTQLISVVVAAPLVARIERHGPHRLARLLVWLHALLIGTALAFALAGEFWLAVAGYWSTTVVRSLASAPYRTWLNLSIADSSSRATVLSITNLADSAGEWSGGPALGWVGTRWSVRVALVAGAVLLAPVLLLLGRAARGGRGDAGVTPGAVRSRG